MTPYFDSVSPAPRDVALPMARDYVAQLTRRLPWFRDRVAAAGGPSADGSVESLDALAAFVAARTRDPGQVTITPFWFQPPGRRPDWTEAGAEWVEGLAAEVAAVITAATGARWVFDPDPRYVTGHQQCCTASPTPRSASRRWRYSTPFRVGPVDRWPRSCRG